MGGQLARFTAASALICSLAGFAGAAHAAGEDPGIPGKGEGTITLLGGVRNVFQGSFIDDQRAAGHDPWKTLFSPGASLSLGYAPEPSFHVFLSLGYGLDKIHMKPGDLAMRSFTILLGADTSLLRRSWGTIYAGGGLGYSLNTLTQNGNNVEANASAGFICLGMRFPLTKSLAFVVEDRFTLASAGLPGSNGPLVYGGLQGSISVGGNLFTIGLQLHYVDSDDKSRPYHP